jgi:hypothetical protein
MIRFRVFALFGLAGGLFLAAGNAPAQFRAQPRVVTLPAQAAPAQPAVIGGELPIVPKSSAAFVSVKVADLVNHPDLKPVLEQLKQTPDALEGVTELFGMPPHEMDRVTLFWPTLSADRWFGAPVLVVTTREAFNEARVLKALFAEPVFNDGPRGRRGEDHWGVKSAPSVKTTVESPKFDPAPKLDLNPPKFDPPSKFEPKPPAEDDPCSAVAPVAAGEPLFYELPRGPFNFLFLIDERTLVFLPEGFGHETTQLALLAQLMQKKATGPLAEAIAAGATHTFAAGIHLPPIFRAFDRKLPPELAPYAALLAARTAVVTGDLAKGAKLTLTLSFDDAAVARRAGPVLEEGLKTLAAKMGEMAAEMKEGDRPRDKAIAPIVEALAAGLKVAGVKLNGSSVVASTEIEVGPAAGKATAALLQSLASEKKFGGRVNHLKQIGLALHAYHDANNKLPTNIFNAKGEVILSWRVHLLPYLEQENLWKQFKLDEPWDSENNKKLIEQMPKVFEAPGRDAPQGKTYFQAFISPDPRKPRPKGALIGTAWLIDADKFGRGLATIPDGTSNTIGVVEARSAVVWSKPDDLPFGEKLPPLGDDRADRFAALFLDGFVRMLPTKLDPATLRALITTDGGEVTPDLDDRRRGFPGGGGAVPRTVPDTEAAPKSAVKDRIKEARREIEALDRGSLQELRAKVDRTRASLEQEKARLELHSRDVERLTKLVDVGAANRVELDKLKATLEQSRLQVEQRKIDLSTLKRQLDGKAPPPLIRQTEKK